MASENKIAANRSNARKSTGPKTVGGKARASSNSFRHGFAAGVLPDAKAVKIVERICEMLRDPDTDAFEREQAQIIAECHVLLARVRTARVLAIERMRIMPPGGYVPGYVLREKVDRIRAILGTPSQRGLNRNIRALIKDGLAAANKERTDEWNRLRSLTGYPILSDSSANYRDGDRVPLSDWESVCHAMPQLLALDRYEKRALSRRRKAIEVLTAIRNCRANRSWNTALDVADAVAP
jgi:hypothetical protein